jgi:hypothetical protein
MALSDLNKPAGLCQARFTLFRRNMRRRTRERHGLMNLEDRSPEVARYRRSEPQG